MNKLVVPIFALLLTSCSVYTQPPAPTFIAPSPASAEPSVSVNPQRTAQPLQPRPLASVNPDLGRRVLYLASAGDEGDDSVYAAIKNDLTQNDAYFSYFRYIDEGIDQIRLGDRANLAVDMLQRANARYGAELAILFSNPTEEDIVGVTLSMFCVQNSELIANATRRIRVSSDAGGMSQARANATQIALQELIDTYFRRVEMSCPPLEFEEN